MPFLETAIGLVGLGRPIWNTFAALRSAAINRNGILIACRYEVNANLALLKELNDDALKDTAIDRREFRTLSCALKRRQAFPFSTMAAGKTTRTL